jgi:nucleotide-binding universal stress UspA family protein
MIRTVLIPCDATEECRLLIRFAAGLKRMGVERAVVGHVVPESGLEGPVIAAKVDAARETLASFAAPLREAGLEVEVRIPAGDPERQLLALAAETAVDAIVAGTRGRSVTDAIFAGGSVAERIALSAGRPVLMARIDLLRNQAEPAALAQSFGMKLLVPTDFSEFAQRALDAVWGLPPKSVGTVRLLHVMPDGSTEEQEAEAELHLRGLAAAGRERGFTCQAVIGHGVVPERVILAEVDESRITGVVVGTRGRITLAEALLGSVSLTLVRQASCPVMVVS